jgi:DHA2 family multidrug resistance protein-like MFS transporter
MALLLVVGPRLLPEFRDPDAGRLDLLSAAQSLVAVLAVIFGVKRIAEGGLGTTAVASILLGLAVGAVFIRRQRRLEEPLVDLRLFRVPAFSAALGMNTAALLVVFGGEFLIAQYLQLVLGLSPLEAGLWTLPSAAGFIVGSMVAPALVRRVRPGLVVAAGLALAAAGFVLLTRVDGASGLEVVVAGSVLLALGAAPVVTLSTDLVVGAAPPERAGVASGLSETAAELGGALGIAILGSIGAVVYRREVADQVPAGVPADAADAARDTLGGALGAAEELPGRLLDAATDAFAQGFQVAAAVSAILMAALAAVALRVLRGAGGNPGHDT